MKGKEREGGEGNGEKRKEEENMWLNVATYVRRFQLQLHPCFGFAALTASSSLAVVERTNEICRNKWFWYGSVSTPAVTMYLLVDSFATSPCLHQRYSAHTDCLPQAVSNSVSADARTRSRSSSRTSFAVSPVIG